MSKTVEPKNQASKKRSNNESRGSREGRVTRSHAEKNSVSVPAVPVAVKTKPKQWRIIADVQDGK